MPVTKPAALALVPPAGAASEPTPHALPRLTISPTEEAAVTALVTGDTAELLEHVRERATAFAGGDQAVRRRALARAAAVQEAVMGELGVLMTQAVARRDLEAARALDRLLTSAACRYRSVLDQLRVESSASRRIMMVARGPVAVCAEEPA